jgi:lysyl-tRNA synthetase class 2
MLERARQYFAAQHVLPVDTPAMAHFPAPDPNIASFSVHSQSGAKTYLQTSPEIYMKRLLASGYPDIYSICRVFRDGEAGKRHCPEFTLAEWYRLDFGLPEIINDTVQFIVACLDRPGLVDNVVHYDYRESFRDFAGLDPFESSIDELANCSNADARLKAALGTHRQAWLDLLISTIIAPQFADDRLTVVRHYPADQAALARLCPDDNRVADRFEVFFAELELANGYVELTDMEEQRQRFERALDISAIDTTLLAALEAGLPDCAGVALGIERLQMVLDQTDDIKDVVTFMAELQ